MKSIIKLVDFLGEVAFPYTLLVCFIAYVIYCLTLI